MSEVDIIFREPHEWEGMSLVEALPYWLTRQLPPRFLPTIAENEVLRGHESPDLLVLLALEPDVADSEGDREWMGRELDGTVGRAVRDLGGADISMAEAWLKAACDEAVRALTGRVWLSEATKNLSTIGERSGIQELAPFRDVEPYAEDEWNEEHEGSIDDARLALLQEFVARHKCE